MNGGKTGGGGGFGNRKRRHRVRCVLACLVELALQVLLGDLEIAHGHGDVFVSLQLAESRQTDSETEHLGGIAGVNGEV